MEAIVKPALHCTYPSKAKTSTGSGANGSSRKRRSDWHYWRSYQQAVLFSQSLSMSAFERRLPLPYDTPTWEASSAETWHKARKAERPPLPFLMAMKLYLNPGKTTPVLNSFSRLLI